MTRTLFALIALHALALLPLLAGCGSAPVTAAPPPTATAVPPVEAAPSVFSREPVAARLVVIHLSDTEAGLLPGEGSETGGLARAQAVLRALDARARVNGIVVAAGDLFIPAPELDLVLDGKSAILQGNTMLGLDVSALGNHELDRGEQFLADAIAQMNFPYVSATVTVKGGPLAKVAVPNEGATPWATDVPGKLVPRVKLCAGPAVEKDPSGVRCPGLVVGVVGATTEQLRMISAGASSNLIVPADLDGIRDAVQKQVDALRSEGIETIVLLSHLQGAAREAELVRAGLVGVDVVVAGGGENKLASPRHRLARADAADRLCGAEGFGPPCYPTTIQARDGRPVLLVATGGDMHYVGNLSVGFDAHGVLTGYDDASSRPWPVDEDALLELRGVLEPPTLAYQQRAQKELAPLLEVVAEADVYLEGSREEIRNRETNFGNLSADAIQSAAIAAGARPAFTLRNGGGVRASIGVIDPQTMERRGGPIRLLDVKTAFRFDSAIVIVETTHAGLVRTLESAFRGAGTSKGHFPQVSGEVFLEYAAGAPEQTHIIQDGRVSRVGCPGARVRNLFVKDAKGKSVVVVKDGRIQSPKARIRLATLEYLATGGDGWFPAEKVRARPVAGVTEQTALRAFLVAAQKAGRTLRGAGYVDGAPSRIVSVSAPADATAPDGCASTSP